MEVAVKATEMVSPARPTPLRKLWCSNLDMLVMRCHVRSVYFYRSDGSPGFFDAAVLKAALAEVLVLFYPAAGRVGFDDSGRPEIDCTGEGALFVEAEANVGLDELGDFGPENMPKITQLVPDAARFGSGHGTSAYPILLLQVTRFRCGGASLGVAVDHLLVDGFAGLHLINSWAATARSSGVPVTPPFLDRTILAARDPPSPSFPHSECHNSAPIGPRPPSVPSSFRLTPAEIERLKSRGGKKADGRPYSTYEAIVGHTWRCVYIARQLPREHKIRLFMAVSVLSRLDPPLPRSYLGNAVLSAVCDTTAGELVEGSIEQVVSRVHGALASLDDAYVRSAIDYLQLQPDLLKLRRVPETYSFPNLSVNGWFQLPLYEADFGWGPPVFVRPVKVFSEGSAYILRQPSDKGGLSPPTDKDGLLLEITLQPQAMEIFRKVFYDF